MSSGSFWQFALGNELQKWGRKLPYQPYLSKSGWFTDRLLSGSVGIEADGSRRAVADEDALSILLRQSVSWNQNMPDQHEKIIVIRAEDAPPRNKPSNYPEPFYSMVGDRTKRPLGDLFGLQSFGVNHVTLPSGAVAALHHRHSVQDEFVMVLTGELMLVHDHGETLLSPGLCAGFPRGGTAHHLVNRSDADATYLEIGDRQSGDNVSYPNDDLKAVRTSSGWQFTHKDGQPY